MDDKNKYKTAPMFEVPEYQEVLGRRLAEFESQKQESSYKNALWGGWHKWAVGLGIVVVLITFAVSITIWQYRNSSVNTESHNEAKTSEQNSSPVAMSITKSASFDTLVRSIQEGKEPKPNGPSLTAEEARKRNGINIIFPDKARSGNISVIYTETSASGNPVTTVICDSGFTLMEEMMTQKPDYAAQIATAEQTKNEASEYLAGDKYQVTIAGHDGLAAKPYSFTGYDGKEYGMPPQLYWWSDGIQYSIMPYKLGFTDTQLIEIAESMYK